MRVLNTTMTAGALFLSGVLAAGCSNTDRADRAAPTDQQPTAAARSDSQLTTEVQARFYNEEALRGRRINVGGESGVVRLSGTVDSEELKQRAATIARSVQGVSEVDNQLQVGAPMTAESSPSAAAVPVDQLTPEPGAMRAQPSGDAASPAGMDASWITTKIQSQYFADADVKSWNVDVDTRGNGIVTLAGRVESDQARQKAEQIARQTEGVQSVENNIRVAQAGRQEQAGTSTDATRSAGDAPVGAIDDAMSDGWITTKIQSKYFVDADVAGRHINVDTQQGQVTLTGEVETEAERRQAVALARNTDGVRDVQNQITVTASREANNQRDAIPGRGAGTQLNDAWITTKIQAKFFMEGDIKGRDINVDTRRGTVTLAGAVDSAAARSMAEQVAGETDGVARVVNRLRVDDAGAPEARTAAPDTGERADSSTPPQR